MSDTPRTDAEECEMFIGVSTFTSGDVRQAFDFARQLERELNAANQRIKRLEELGNKLRQCAGQLGWTSSEDSRWIERAEAAVEAWDKEAKP